MRPEWHGASWYGFEQEFKILPRLLRYTCDYISECRRRGLSAAADICLPSKLTDLECTLASILLSAADFVTVGYDAYDLGNDHTRQPL